MVLIPCIIAGCGPGSADFITPQVSHAVTKAELIAGTLRLLALFPNSQAQHLPYNCGLKKFLQDLTPHMGEKNVVVLVSGDPGIASLAETIGKHFPKYPIQRLPGISSVQLAFAKIGINWMDAIIIRGHGSLPTWNTAWETHSGPFALLAGEASTPSLAARLAQRLGRKYVWRCEQLGTSKESIARITPRRLIAEGCRELAIIIIEGA
jgi:precorrin-6y C5,15-methyltransferase (decarboxylating) CbiE subunit